MTSVAAIKFDLSIPPKAADYQDAAEHRFNQDYILYSLLPHMHLRGKPFASRRPIPTVATRSCSTYLDTNSTGRTTTSSPSPSRCPRGQSYSCVGHFDNSADNLE